MTLLDNLHRLDEFTRAEWRDVARRLRPEWSDEEFERAWAEFVEMKRRRGLQ
jgi:hypothetical protein